jgi:hypothetical protein
MLTNVISLFCEWQIQVSEMPKLVVLVVKDDTGKLWNYVSTEEELVRNQESFGAGSLWIHKPEPPVDTSQNAGPAELAAGDKVTVGVLLPHGKARARPRIKEK